MRKTMFALIFLSGCTTTTGVIPDGVDAYRVMHAGDTGFTNATTLQKNAYAEAQSFCGSKGQIVETVKMDSKQARPFGGWPEATLIFRCVNRE